MLPGLIRGRVRRLLAAGALTGDVRLRCRDEVAELPPVGSGLSGPCVRLLADLNALAELRNRDAVVLDLLGPDGIVRSWKGHDFNPVSSLFSFDVAEELAGRESIHEEAARLFVHDGVFDITTITLTAPNTNENLAEAMCQEGKQLGLIFCHVKLNKLVTNSPTSGYLSVWGAADPARHKSQTCSLCETRLIIASSKKEAQDKISHQEY